MPTIHVWHIIYTCVVHGKMRPLSEYFVNHVDVRRDATPHMYLEHIREAVIKAMQSGQCCALVLRLRLGDHVMRYSNEFVAPPITPRARDSPPGASATCAPTGVMRFEGCNLRDMLTMAPMPDPDAHFILRSCMTEVIDWVYANGLTWFLATHNTERSERNIFTKSLIVPSKYVLFLHWYPETFDTATVAKSLHKFWISRLMPVPTDASILQRMYTIIMHAMTNGAVHCTLLMLQRGIDFTDDTVSGEGIICTDPKRLLDYRPLVDQYSCLAYYLNKERHDGLVQWLTKEQGLGWFLVLPHVQSTWAYFVATWERVGVPLDDQ